MELVRILDGLPEEQEVVEVALWVLLRWMIVREVAREEARLWRWSHGGRWERFW